MDLRELYNRQAHEQRHWSPWNDPNHKDRAKVVVELATRHLPENGRMLDAGCGHGEIAAAVAERRPDAEVIGVDVSDVWIEEARRRHADVPNVEFHRADVRDLPFEDGRFDLTVCSEVLEHIPDWERAVDELKRVTRETLVITIPHDLTPDGVYHVNELRPEDVIRAVGSEPVERIDVPTPDPDYPVIWCMVFKKK